MLKRDGLGPRTYKLVAPTRESTFLKELNEAGAQGFKLLPGFVKHSENHWMGLLERQANGAQFAYSFGEGGDAGTKALVEAHRRGATVVSFVGAGMFVLEEPRAVPTSEGGTHEFVAVDAGKTSSLEKEIQERAALGFRVSKAGFMSVLMERDPTATPVPIEYRLIAMLRVETAERELKQAGAEGFHVAVVPESRTEGVFVLERTAASSKQFDYAVLRLAPQNADAWLVRAEAAGYRTVVLFDRIAVLERAIP